MRSYLSVCMAVVIAGLFTVACQDRDEVSAPAPTEIGSFTPNLPAVPNVPPPRHPITYPDGTYSVYGARKRIDQLINTDIKLTAYVAKQYEPPECPEGRTCPPPAMPHLWLADEAEETDPIKMLTVVGYANSQLEMEEAKEDHEAGKVKELPEGVYLPPVVFDWETGHKYEVKGTFTRISGAGFLRTEGLLDYAEHKCLDCPEEEEETQ